jgi:hypothetical protein
VWELGVILDVLSLGRAEVETLVDLAGYAQLPADRFNRLALLKKRAADLCNRLHDQQAKRISVLRLAAWPVGKAATIGSS